MEANKKRQTHYHLREFKQNDNILGKNRRIYVSECSIIYLRLLVNGLPSSIVNIGVHMDEHKSIIIGCVMCMCELFTMCRPNNDLMDRFWIGEVRKKGM